ncbi:hypothetical protein TNCV_2520881 [Trichonephila clavipes]|nr:hypothetical protein TNCV_2520881 [Trichonephila clavipes]
MFARFSEESILRVDIKRSSEAMFTNHKASILIASSKSLGVMNYNNKYYFTDSPACDPKSVSASDTHDEACGVEYCSLDDLVRVCKHATGSERGRQLESKSKINQIHAFNQIYAFKVLNQETQEENFEELKMPEQHLTDDKFLNARRAMNIGQKDVFLFRTEYFRTTKSKR